MLKMKTQYHGFVNNDKGARYNKTRSKPHGHTLNGQQIT